MTAQLSTLKATVPGALAAVTRGEAPSIWAKDAKLNISDPFGSAIGDAAPTLWATLRLALPDVERRDHLIACGENYDDPRIRPSRAGRIMLATHGVYQGAFTAPLCDIPATGGLVTLRFCEVYELTAEGQIRQGWILWDLLDLMRQAGCWPLAPSLGAEGAWMPPASGLSTNADPATGQIGFDTVMAMHQALLSFDGKSLDSMDHAAHWTDDFLWYGPAGIGTTRGLEQFRAHHQIPFLRGFPDRQGAGHYVRIGDGPFVVTGGWPSVRGTHQGEWLGLPPTGKPVAMRVMDFYRLDGAKIAENWVPIDMIHLLGQIGVDVLARMRHLTGRPDRRPFG